MFIEIRAPSPLIDVEVVQLAFRVRVVKRLAETPPPTLAEVLGAARERGAAGALAPRLVLRVYL